ncbi:hypothetical protein ACR77J_15865 [Tissierella praeacuta]|uniref:hypothetical protein n=1 Tax=Tissierella praeacuta TaxID=43131 RepID=UPI003DA2383D
MKATNIKIQYPEDPNQMEIVLTIKRTQQNIQEVAKLKDIVEKGKLLNVDIKRYRQRRSLDANAYCFVLCQKIAEVIGNTKEYVYKQAIKQVGQFEIVPIRDDAVEEWIRRWESRGLGWQSEIWRDSKLEGYTTTINYYGSSVYDTKEMSILLEEIVLQAKELGIDTMTGTERKQLLDMWEEIKHD